MKINDKITYDAITKKASIMRDGEYLYLAGELGLTDRDVYEPIRVYRPEAEVLKAYERFKELGRLPVTCEHPKEFLDLGIEDSYNLGEGKNPEYIKKTENNLLTCDILLKGDVLDEYNKGVRELSCGWEGEFEPASKEGLGYEYIQRFKDINHIALVSAGRCGKECKVADKKMVKDAKFEIYAIDKDGKEHKISITASDRESAEKHFVKEYEPKGYEYMSIKKISDSVVKDGNYIVFRYGATNPIVLKDNKEAKMFKDEDVILNPENEVGVNEPEEKHLELTLAQLVELLIFAGLDEEAAKAKANEYFTKLESEKQEAGEPALDEDVKEAKEELKEEEEKKEEVKTTDKAVVDKLISDAIEKGKVIGRAEAVKRFSTVMPVIKSGEFKLSDLEGKTACQIKSMYIEKVLNEKISDSDVALDKVFEIAIKNKKVEEINFVDETSSLIQEIEKINKGDK